MRRPKWLTIAMVFTLSRFVLGAVGIMLLALGYKWWGFAILVVAFFTDFADGQAARRLKQITELGALLDPIADKLLVAEIIIYMIAAGVLPWLPAILILIFELTSTFWKFYLKRKNVVLPSNQWGKIKFQFQWLFLLFYFINLPTIGIWILATAVIMTAISLSNHIYHGWKAIKTSTI
jgi:CDP-diacylglycerol--glycerol-3-phosphate 3-phosphatidyltransferase